ncbi:DUF4239 domain-containing protein [Methylocystis bryophila]|uniref:DUF4239 domain-containing protein n=1 Tax=Methylocystis bryophila TaxID=655015 RepID=A0A1W6N030_9HYPH|nr:DUF4239 domain-containing protein [Methylocystis bryophila]ARN83197.1 hypothetical protein B1812_21325 [Methylocystis bryophila]BDV39537.1 hypothetical protein DSM21852_27900 [Methylocystis bryophila]
MFTMYWVYDYPSWQMGLLFVGVLVTLTWGGILVARATIHARIHSDRRTNDMVGLALTGYFALFGLLIGLIAVASYQNFSNTIDLVDKEAGSIGALSRDLSAYPQAIRGQLLDQLREYTRQTIEDDWPEQRKGVVPNGGTERVNALGTTLFAFEPSKKSEEIIHVEALTQFNHLLELRRQRLANVTLGLPATVWEVVLFGALLSIALIWLLDMELHVHLILGGILASMLAAVIFLTVAMDNAFRGEVSVGPESIALVYDTLPRADRTTNNPEPPSARSQATSNSAPTLSAKPEEVRPPSAKPAASNASYRASRNKRHLR